MTGHRMSHLPIAQFCGKAWELDVGAGRAAAMSSAFHAICAGSPPAEELWARLTDREQEEISAYHKPEDTEFLGHALRYAEAEKEVELGLDEMGFSATIADAFCPGHMDLGWVVEQDGKRYAIVGDIKRSRWTSHPGSLQLHAYGTAYAQKHGCVGYGLGIWAATDGLWFWGDRFYELGSSEHDAIVERLLYAASHRSDDYATGDHCGDCYGRLRCPAWTLPAALAETELAPVAEGQALTPESSGKVMDLVERLEKLCERAKENIKAYHQQGGKVLLPGGTKEYRFVGGGKGRESTSVAAVRAAFGAKAEKVIKVNDPKPSFRKVNV